MAAGELPAEVRELVSRSQRVDGLDDVEPAPVTEAANSRIAALREQHRRIGQQHSIVIEFPWWQGKLAGRFRYIDDQGLKRLLSIAQRNVDDPEAVARMNADAIIRACDELVCRVDDDGEWEPLVDGERIRIDKRLAEVLSLTGAGDTARSVLEALWTDRTQATLAIAEIAGEYGQWIRGRAPEVAHELAGESET